jgi:hypothetical protein
MDKLEVATVFIFSIWFIYAGSLIRAMGEGNRRHALAKLLLAVLLSFAVYGVLVHWAMAVVLFALSFVVYLRSRRQLVGRRSFHGLSWYDRLR